MAKASKGPGLFILDACVFLDFLKTEREVLPLVGLHLGTLHVPEPLLSEIRDANESEIRKLGILVIEPKWEHLGKAASSRGALSFNDHLCLLMAKDNGHSCITNDKALIRACSEESVPTIRGLRLLLNLVSAGAITKRRAMRIGRLIHESNPHHIGLKILEDFQMKLESLTD